MTRWSVKVFIHVNNRSTQASTSVSSFSLLFKMYVNVKLYIGLSEEREIHTRAALIKREHYLTISLYLFVLHRNLAISCQRHVIVNKNNITRETNYVCLLFNYISNQLLNADL